MNKCCLLLLLLLAAGGTRLQARQSPASSDIADVPLEQLLRFEVSSEPANADEDTDPPADSELSDPDFIVDPDIEFPDVSRIGVSVRYVAVRNETYQEGRRKVSTSELLNRYDAVMSRMEFEARVLSLTYRPNEKWMVNFGVPFLRTSAIRESASGDLSHFAVNGVSDLDLNVSRYFILDPQTKFAVNLGLGIPTGSIDEKAGGKLAAYAFQLGTGTWDLSPGLAIMREAGRFEYGAAVEAEIRLGENSRDYSLGDTVVATAWLDYVHSPWLEVGVFVRGAHKDELSANPRSNNPGLFWNPENYGGKSIEGGVAARLLHPSCPYGGKFLEIRASKPLWEETNGVHFINDWMLDIGVGISF